MKRFRIQCQYHKFQQYATKHPIHHKIKYAIQLARTKDLHQISCLLLILQNEDVCKEEELTTSKENLKSFIERWEEHPNSPYIFDANSTLILPVRNGNKSGSSGFSSTRCSPSPCESLSSNTELFSENGPAENGVNADDELLENHDEPVMRRNQSAREIFERPSSVDSIPTLKQNKEYLQSFDRRHSDSNYVVNHNSSLEKVNLAEEIKKLSDRLMMLSSINTELQDYNKRISDGQSQKTAQDAKSKENTKLPSNDKRDKPEILKNIKNSKFNEQFSKSLNVMEMKSSKGSTFVRSKSILSNGTDVSITQTSSKSVVSDLTERLKALDETPSLFKKMVNVRSVCEKVTDSVEDAITLGDNQSSVPWPITNRRTKFRITQMSRDVPIGSPDTHQTIFLEETANSTKDCLLHLLEKYEKFNGQESKSGNGIRRHQSISVGCGIADNLEYHSMNSINAFFKRSAFLRDGATVKKIQARMESKGTQ